QLETLRPAGATWMATDSPSLADATLMPVFFFLDAFDGPFGTARLLDARPGLKAWWAHAKATPEGQRMVAEQQAGLAAFMQPKAA
ncbi:MAG: glutathione S-transferase domain-containing protein, partial [Sphingomonadaceae bacterium]